MSHRTKLREYSYFYMLVATSGITGIGTAFHSSTDLPAGAVASCVILCLIIGGFASWKFWKIHQNLKIAEAEADAHATDDQKRKIEKELNEA